MATEYSLLTCLGRDGLTVTMTIASPCVVTLNAHGMPDGHPIRFTATGALPTGLAINTTYYVKSPATNTFNVAATSGGAAINTSGSQSGTHKAIGEYWATLPATDPGNGGNYRARYGAAGSERVYAGLHREYNDPRGFLYKCSPQLLTDCVLEVQGEWDDKCYAYPPYILGWKSVTITSVINGRRGSAYHAGTIGRGYRAVGTNSSAFTMSMPDVVVDGISVANTYATGDAFSFNSIKTTVKNCIVSAGRTGLPTSGYYSQFINNIVYDCTTGIVMPAGTSMGLGILIAFNVVHGCTLGFLMEQNQYYGYNHNLIGNIAVGNTVNWGTPNYTAFLPNRFVAMYNFGDSSDIKVITFTASPTNAVNLAAHGLTVNTPIRFINNGDTIPIVGHTVNTIYYVRTIINADSFTLTATYNGSTNITITGTDSGTHSFSKILDSSPSGSPDTRNYVASTDFIDYINRDFRPALSSSPQVEIITLASGDGLPRYDITDAVRPNYINATTDKADAGPFEFNHGNGLAPLQVQIAIAGMVSGSVLAIYKASDMTAIAAPATTSGSYSASYTYTGDTAIIVRVRKGTSGGKYLPYEYTGTITSAGFSLNVSQILDPIA